MFTVQASISDLVTIRTDIESVRIFLRDFDNFRELMPGIEEIHLDRSGHSHWKIRTEIPVVGHLTERFALQFNEDDGYMEWSPVAGTIGNFLRFSATLEECDADTDVRFALAVEMRRDAGKNLHVLAPIAGEHRISREMERRVGEMIRTFIARIKQRLER